MDRERQACPECNGSGVYQEYDEFDRYAVYACATCDGSGELALIDTALVEPSDADVAVAIAELSKPAWKIVHPDWVYKPDFPRLVTDKTRATAIAALRQYQKPTDEKIRQAIEWQSCLKDHHQHEWEGTDIDWQMEPGAQAEHDEMMQAFDLAIQALRQMKGDPK